MTDRYIDEEGNERVDMLWDELIPEDGKDYDKYDPYLLEAELKQREAIKQQRAAEAAQRANAPQDDTADTQFTLRFKHSELNSYTEQRQLRLAKK
jgi:hypothetical protein